MKGLHLTADLYRCRCEAAWLVDAQRLGTWSRAAAQAVDLHPVADLFHVFAPGTGGGVAVTLLMPEAQVHLRTWPAERSVTVDVLVVERQEQHAAKARGLMLALVSRFQPEWTEQRSLDRGEEE